jgi:hypothetical protein
MNGNCIRYISQEGDKDTVPTGIMGRKARETYISPQKELRNSRSRDNKGLATSPGRFLRAETSREKDGLPPKCAPFQRNRILSTDKTEKERNDSQPSGKGAEDNRREVLKFSQIKKKLEEEMLERERLQ